MLLYLISLILNIYYLTFIYPLYLHKLRDILQAIPERLLQAIPKILYTYYLVIDATLNIKEKLY